jgi:hypothetical protein
MGDSAELLRSFIRLFDPSGKDLRSHSHDSLGGRPPISGIARMFAIDCASRFLLTFSDANVGGYCDWRRTGWVWPSKLEV